MWIIKQIPPNFKDIVKGYNELMAGKDYIDPKDVEEIFDEIDYVVTCSECGNSELLSPASMSKYCKWCGIPQKNYNRDYYERPMADLFEAFLSKMAEDNDENQDENEENDEKSEENT